MPEQHSATANSLALATPALARQSAWRSLWYFSVVLVGNEIRLRSRRWSTLAAIFLVMLVCWNMIVDPASGMAMMTINGRRTLYTSSAIAIASASLLGMVLLFAGFYLIRGRVAEDLRCGMAHVIAASAVSNWQFLTCRYLANLAYFMLLAYTGMFSVMVLHAVRGEPGIHFSVYWQTYTLIFLPLACYVVGMAALFDSVPRLMGKLGDLIFFIFWSLQLSLLALVIKPGGPQNLLWFAFDFSGLMTLVLNMQDQMQTTQFSIGASSFDPALTPWVLPEAPWSLKFVILRLASMGVALLPFLLAIVCFHRYSPDRLSLSQAAQRRSLMRFLNDFFQPARQLLLPLTKLNQKLPAPLAVVFAEMLVSLQSAPFLLLLISGLGFAACVLPATTLPTILKFFVVAWGMLIADIASRDFQSGMQALTGVHHGAVKRYLRQFTAAWFLALLFTLPLILRIALHDVVSAWYAILGFFSIALLAASMGSVSGTARLFTALFLLWFYFATQAHQISKLDLFGFNRVADATTLLVLAAIALGAFVVGYLYNRQSFR